VNAGPCQTGPSVAALFGASLTDVSGKVEVSLTLRATLRRHKTGGTSIPELGGKAENTTCLLLSAGTAIKVEDGDISTTPSFIVLPDDVQIDVGGSSGGDADAATFVRPITLLPVSNRRLVSTGWTMGVNAVNFWYPQQTPILACSRDSTVQCTCGMGQGYNAEHCKWTEEDIDNVIEADWANALDNHVFLEHPAPAGAGVEPPLSSDSSLWVSSDDWLKEAGDSLPVGSLDYSWCRGMGLDSSEWKTFDPDSPVDNTKNLWLCSIAMFGAVELYSMDIREVAASCADVQSDGDLVSLGFTMSSDDMASLPSYTPFEGGGGIFNSEESSHMLNGYATYCHDQGIGTCTIYVMYGASHRPYAYYTSKPRTGEHGALPCHQSNSCDPSKKYNDDPNEYTVEWDISMNAVPETHEPFYSDHVRASTLATGADYRGTVWESWLWGENTVLDSAITAEITARVGDALLYTTPSHFNTTSGSIDVLWGDIEGTPMSARMSVSLTGSSRELLNQTTQPDFHGLISILLPPRTSTLPLTIEQVAQFTNLRAYRPQWGRGPRSDDRHGKNGHPFDTNHLGSCGSTAPAAKRIRLPKNFTRKWPGSPSDYEFYLPVDSEDLTWEDMTSSGDPFNCTRGAGWESKLLDWEKNPPRHAIEQLPTIWEMAHSPYTRDSSGDITGTYCTTRNDPGGASIIEVDGEKRLEYTAICTFPSSLDLDLEAVIPIGIFGNKVIGSEAPVVSIVVDDDDCQAELLPASLSAPDVVKVLWSKLDISAVAKSENGSTALNVELVPLESMVVGFVVRLDQVATGDPADADCFWRLGLGVRGSGTVPTRALLSNLVDLLSEITKIPADQIFVSMNGNNESGPLSTLNSVEISVIIVPDADTRVLDFDRVEIGWSSLLRFMNPLLPGSSPEMGCRDTAWFSAVTSVHRPVSVARSDIFGMDSILFSAPARSHGQWQSSLGLTLSSNEESACCLLSLDTSSCTMSGVSGPPARVMTISTSGGVTVWGGYLDQTWTKRVDSPDLFSRLRVKCWLTSRVLWKGSIVSSTHSVESTVCLPSNPLASYILPQAHFAFTLELNQAETEKEQLISAPEIADATREAISEQLMLPPEMVGVTVSTLVMENDGLPVVSGTAQITLTPAMLKVTGGMSAFSVDLWVSSHPLPLIWDLDSIVINGIATAGSLKTSELSGSLQAYFPCVSNVARSDSPSTEFMVEMSVNGYFSMDGGPEFLCRKHWELISLIVRSSPGGSLGRADDITTWRVHHWSRSTFSLISAGVNAYRLRANLIIHMWDARANMVNETRTGLGEGCLGLSRAEGGCNLITDEFDDVEIETILVPPAFFNPTKHGGTLTAVVTAQLQGELLNLGDADCQDIVDEALRAAIEGTTTGGSPYRNQSLWLASPQSVTSWNGMSFELTVHMIEDDRVILRLLHELTERGFRVREPPVKTEGSFILSTPDIAERPMVQAVWLINRAGRYSIMSSEDALTLRTAVAGFLDVDTVRDVNIASYDLDSTSTGDSVAVLVDISMSHPEKDLNDIILRLASTSASVQSWPFPMVQQRVTVGEGNAYVIQSTRVVDSALELARIVSIVRLENDGIDGCPSVISSWVTRASNIPHKDAEFDDAIANIAQLEECPRVDVIFICDDDACGRDKESALILVSSLNSDAPVGHWLLRSETETATVDPTMNLLRISIYGPITITETWALAHHIKQHAAELGASDVMVFPDVPSNFRVFGLVKWSADLSTSRSITSVESLMRASFSQLMDCHPSMVTLILFDSSLWQQLNAAEAEPARLNMSDERFNTTSYAFFGLEGFSSADTARDAALWLKTASEAHLSESIPIGLRVIIAMHETKDVDGQSEDRVSSILWLLTGPFISAFFLVFCGWSLARRRARMARATHPADIADMSTTPRHGSARLINNYVGTPGNWTVSSEKSAGDMNELMA